MKESSDVWLTTVSVTLLQMQGGSAYIVSILIKMVEWCLTWSTCCFHTAHQTLPTVLIPTGHFFFLHKTFQSVPFFLTYLTNWPLFSIVCALIDHRSYVANSLIFTSKWTFANIYIYSKSKIGKHQEYFINMLAATGFVKCPLLERTYLLAWEHFCVNVC